MAGLRLAAFLSLAPSGAPPTLEAASPCQRAPISLASGGAAVDSPRFSFRDRLQLTHWEARACAVGIGRVRLEPAGPDFGEFLLLYGQDGQWARWGIAPSPGGRFEVWSMADGRTLGCHDSLQAALARVAEG